MSRPLSLAFLLASMMLAPSAQAIEEDCTLLTHDPILPTYGPPVQPV